MCRLCLFAGTAEGRELCQVLLRAGAQVHACAATEYGAKLLGEHPHLTVSDRRLDRGDMEALFRAQGFDAVVDATHPYAVEVTENIKTACDKTGVEYIRLSREEGNRPKGAVYAADARAAAQYLADREGNILLATGSKELGVYAQVIPDFPRRVWARVLPLETSLAACRDCGLPPAHILALQGPFSREMDLAMLHSVEARYLVTKDDGGRGGFGEKVQASEEAGCTLVVIGRPPEAHGLSPAEVRALLSRRFGLVLRPRVAVVGIGPGGGGDRTVRAQEAIREAQVLIGAERMLQSVALPGQRTIQAIAPQDILSALRDWGGERAAVVLSGDVGFFSGAKGLLPLLKDYETELIPGLSSLVTLCARFGESYEDVVPLSLHGRTADPVSALAQHPRLFALVGGREGMRDLCARLTQGGYGDAWVRVGQRLGYPDEALAEGTARQLMGEDFDPLSVALIERRGPGRTVTHGLPDEVFSRSAQGPAVPMTKREVRGVALSLLELTRESVCWDIGAGTGSVSVEMALQAAAGEVWAVERRADALELLEENARKFGLSNLHMVPGEAPAACAQLPAPTHVFIGGSGGELMEVLKLAREKNPRVRVVATAVALETVGALAQAMTALPWAQTQAVSLTAARARAAGPYHLMAGQNPVTVFTFQG